MRLVRGLPSPGLLLVLAAGISCSGCRSPLPNRDPVGEPFPPVTGTSLAGEEVRLPPGEPAILLIGYVQEAQFDADRWLIGLQQVGPPVRVLEVPTVEGLFPRALASSIDEGMRSGIPSEDWASVVTVYGDGAEEIVRFTGDTRPRNMRVVLVDAGGVVRWFHDRGFSAGKLLELVGEAGGWRLEAGGWRRVTVHREAGGEDGTDPYTCPAPWTSRRRAGFRLDHEPTVTLVPRAR